MSEFPYERYDCANVSSVLDYKLLAATRPSIVTGYVPSGITEGDLLGSLKDLVNKKLLNRCVAVIEAIETFPTVIYNLTSPYPELDKGHGSLGTRVKSFCRQVGYSIKEGNWIAFAHEDVATSVVAVYLPTISFHWSDFEQGIQEYKVRQFEAEKVWALIQEHLSNEAFKKLNMA